MNFISQSPYFGLLGPPRGTSITPRFWSKSPQPSLATKLWIWQLTRHLVLTGLTFHQDLGDLRVAGAEGTVQLEAVSVIQKGAPQREQHFLDWTRRSAVSACLSSSGSISGMSQGAHTCQAHLIQHHSHLPQLFFAHWWPQTACQNARGLHIYVTDTAFGLLSNYNGDATVFQACVFKMTYLGCLDVNEKICTRHFGKGRNLNALISSCWEAEETHQVNAGNANTP